MSRSGEEDFNDQDSFDPSEVTNYQVCGCLKLNGMGSPPQVLHAHGEHHVAGLMANFDVPYCGHCQQLSLKLQYQWLFDR